MGKKRQRGNRGEPWFRNSDQCWYITTADGKAQRLIDKKEQYIKGKGRQGDAYTVWHEMKAKGEASINKDDNEVRVILDIFLTNHVQPTAAPKTFKEWKKTYRDFCDRWPGLLVKDLNPVHLRTWWTERPTWGSSTQNGTGTALKAAGADSGKLITSNPLDGMKLPPVLSRGKTTLISEEDHERLLAIVPEDLRDVLVVLREVGTRPCNVWRATKANFDAVNGVLFYADHKTSKKTGEHLVVPLTPKAVELCSRLAEQHPEGPLFRTKKGGAWNPQKLASRLLWYKKKLKLDHVICYGYRHSTATDLLLQGVPDTEVAAILGQKNTNMIHKHYSHLGSKINRLRDTLTKARAKVEAGVTDG